MVGNFVDQTVAAQHETIAAHDGQARHIAAHGGLNAQGAGDDVAAWVSACFFFGDVAGGNQFLHVAVVDSDAL